jgi:hypothetical protein
MAAECAAGGNHHYFCEHYSHFRSGLQCFGYYVHTCSKTETLPVIIDPSHAENRGWFRTGAQQLQQVPMAYW